MALTVFQTDTALATEVHAVGGGDEKALSDTADAGTTETAETMAAGTDVLLFCFTSATTFPNSADWPNGTYSAVLDCTNAGANVSYGVLTRGASSGHFARVDAGLTADAETTQQSEAAFTGTGLKTASQTWDPAAGASDDRFEVLVAGQNSASMNSPQSITLTFDTDAAVTGPWGDGEAPAAVKRRPARRRIMGVGA